MRTSLTGRHWSFGAGAGLFAFGAPPYLPAMERINTIGALIKHNHRLGAYCNSVDCHHYKQLDLQALGERLGMDHSSMRPDLTPRLKCSRCGGRDIALILFGNALGPR